MHVCTYLGVRKWSNPQKQRVECWVPGAAGGETEPGCSGGGSSRCAGGLRPGALLSNTATS